jgi:YD repeat-containing protein
VSLFPGHHQTAEFGDVHRHQTAFSRLSAIIKRSCPLPPNGPFPPCFTVNQRQFPKGRRQQTGNFNAALTDTQQNTYDGGDGHLTTTDDTDSLGHVTRTSFNAAGQSTAVTLAYGTTAAVTTSYGYTSGNLTSVTDPNSNETEFTYNDAGQEASAKKKGVRLDLWWTNPASQIRQLTWQKPGPMGQ